MVDTDPIFLEIKLPGYLEQNLGRSLEEKRLFFCLFAQNNRPHPHIWLHYHERLSLLDPLKIYFITFSNNVIFLVFFKPPQFLHWLFNLGHLFNQFYLLLFELVDDDYLFFLQKLQRINMHVVLHEDDIWGQTNYFL